MAMSMGPPLLPGYSLRVQLFSPNAQGSADKPIRCFRVVTSPDVTVREFCQEASRIHEINYGEYVKLFLSIPPFQGRVLTTCEQTTCRQESSG